MEPQNPEPQSQTQSAAAPQAQPQDENAPKVESYAWEASEFVHHEKPASWYAGLWLVAAIICAILGLLQQWLSIVVVIVMTFAVIVYSKKEPRTLQYSLDEHGVSINGNNSPYALFKSYSVQPEVGWQEIDLEPARRFAPRLTLISDGDEMQQIEAVLSKHLPRLDRDPDWIERLSRYLKF